MLIIFSGLILRALLAIYNISYGVLPGAGSDGLSFHLEAVRFMDWLNLKYPDNTYILTEWLSGYADDIGVTHGDRYATRTVELKLYSVGWIYSAFLGHLYNIFGVSHIATSLLSCFVWFLSAITLRGILLRCKIDNSKINLALLFYCFLFPTSVIYTSVTLREVYILFFINFVVLLFFILKDQKNYFFIFLNLIIISLFLFMLGYLHRSNIVFIALFLASVASYFIIKKLITYCKNKKFHHLNKLIIIMCVAMIFIFDYSGYMQKIFSSIQSYQTGHFHEITIFRASYFTIEEVASREYSIFNFFYYSFKNLLYYFIQPSIFQISNLKDFVLAFENIMRLIMVFYSVNKIYRYPNNNTLLHILFMFFIFSEIPYSQATINWGTASRHHLQVLGILIVLFLYPKKSTK